MLHVACVCRSDERTPLFYPSAGTIRNNKKGGTYRRCRRRSGGDSCLAAENVKSVRFAPAERMYVPRFRVKRRQGNHTVKKTHMDGVNLLATGEKLLQLDHIK